MFNTHPPKEVLLVPNECKTVASQIGENDYRFIREGGWSAIPPFISGMYALACQVKPDITPDIFWNTALKTGEPRTIKRDDKEFIGKIINPVKLIESLKDK